jgi:hypothetical protein
MSSDHSQRDTTATRTVCPSYPFFATRANTSQGQIGKLGQSLGHGSHRVPVQTQGQNLMDTTEVILLKGGA